MFYVQPPTSSLMRLSRKLILLSPGFPLLLLLLTATQSDAAPAGKAKVFGPCVGMDCMHGVLMHGDAKAGDSHGVEDAEKRREELQRANAAAGEKPGQLNQEEFLHGVLMHGDAKAGSAHSHDPAPTVEKRPVQNGPMNQEDLMHGVLMHGDSNPDHKHRHSQADQAALKAGGASDGVPGVESRPSGFADSEDEGLLGRWWRTLKYLVTGSGDGDSDKGGSRPTSAADFNLMQDLAAVGSTKTVAELDQAARHSHRDTDKAHRERDRREHANTVHVEH
ncbi:hypothetical protein BOX15_Mlig023571g1 [Macrostomum lignano]|uniref:Uncharacterized protein n=1 Tax=Macrostomum lignano TaxID=282301 RepID=A0A267E6W9_9PLAT|nr:hypothetical protein BOX15_Mlig023571g1 [Macrostomum lignano]